jgi:hypothetical protein
MILRRREVHIRSLKTFISNIVKVTLKLKLIVPMEGNI